MISSFNLFSPSNGLGTGIQSSLTTAGNAANADQTGIERNSSATTVTLSAQAQSVLSAQTNASVSLYGQFFATRDGSPAIALATAVTDPAAESSSIGKNRAQVASDARARLDAKYAELQASGKPFDINSSQDWYTLFGDLDRRSLSAVSNNQGGKFTQDEQNLAQSILGQQLRLAVGIYSPTGELRNIGLDFAGQADRAKATVKFLDSVSSEEKGSVAWAVERVSAQKSYEAAVQNQNKTPEKLDTDNPLVKLIETALNSIKDNIARGTTHGRIQTADDLKNQPWFQGFGDQLDAILQQLQPKNTSGVDLSV